MFGILSGVRAHGAAAWRRVKAVKASVPAWVVVGVTAAVVGAVAAVVAVFAMARSRSTSTAVYVEADEERHDRMAEA